MIHSSRGLAVLWVHFSKRFTDLSLSYLVRITCMPANHWGCSTVLMSHSSGAQTLSICLWGEMGGGCTYSMRGNYIWFANELFISQFYILIQNFKFFTAMFDSHIRNSFHLSYLFFIGINRHLNMCGGFWKVSDVHFHYHFRLSPASEVE